MGKIMADCNAVGCPLLPGEDVADDDDECADDMSRDQAEALERQLFAKEEKENILHNGFTTPDNAFGEDRTMGISSWLRKTNARQIRNRHHTINKAKEAIRKKDKLQLKLFSNDMAFDRCKHCRTCVAHVMKQKHPKMDVRIPKRAHHKLCTFNTIARGRSESYVKSQKFFERNNKLGKASLGDWRKENPNYPSVLACCNMSTPHPDKSPENQDNNLSPENQDINLSPENQDFNSSPKNQDNVNVSDPPCLAPTFGETNMPKSCHNLQHWCTSPLSQSLLPPHCHCQRHWSEVPGQEVIQHW